MLFDNSYNGLPQEFFERINPVPVQDPQLIIFNDNLAKTLGIDESKTRKQLAELFSGNVIPKGSSPIALAYAGHQFGQFVSQLGDGRAVLLGEISTPEQKHYDIQLKGSGQTKFSRQGDGRAPLGPVIREYIVSEAMHALGIPSTRSLAAVTTGEKVYRETALPGGILTRIAESHIRVGTFEYFAAQNKIENLKTLAEYTIKRHFPLLKDSRNSYLSLLELVCDRQIELIAKWMGIGFIHGVMNTDNTSIVGETIDYGPCAFMDNYDPRTVFSSIDHQGRYCFINQSLIAHWNVSRFAETLIPLLDNNEKKAITIGEEIINSFSEKFQSKWLSMMRQKLGLFGEKNNDEKLVNNLLSLMHQNNTDYTNTFCDLMKNKLPNNSFYQHHKFVDWFKEWKNRQSQNKMPKKLSLSLMRSANPYVIPRNHKVEEVLTAASESGDLKPMKKLLNELNKPYDYREDINEYRIVPKTSNIQYQTFCGT